MFKMKRVEKTEAELLAIKADKDVKVSNIKSELKTWIKNEIKTRDLEMSDIWKYVFNKYPNTYTDTEIYNVCLVIKDEMENKDK
jgi:hypothetical protein